MSYVSRKLKNKKLRWVVKRAEHLFICLLEWACDHPSPYQPTGTEYWKGTTVPADRTRLLAAWPSPRPRRAFGNGWVRRMRSVSWALRAVPLGIPLSPPQISPKQIPLKTGLHISGRKPLELVVAFAGVSGRACKVGVICNGWFWQATSG